MNITMTQYTYQILNYNTERDITANMKAVSN